MKGGWSSPKLAAGRLLPRVDRGLTSGLAVLVLLTGLVPVAIVVATGVLVGSVGDALAEGFGSLSVRRAILALALLGLLFAVLQVSAAARVAVADALGLELERHS